MNRQDQIDQMAYKLMLTGKSLDTVYPDDCEKIAAVLYDEGCRMQSENTVEVVRCKDCEYWDRDNIKKHTYSSDDSTLADFAECKYWSDYVTCHSTRYNDYCSLAKRRADNEQNSRSDKSLCK